jgi:hypothetical protein
LILKTMPLQYGYDPLFGSALNKFQYATPPQKNGEKKWRIDLREAIRKNLKALLIVYEPRLKIDDVIIELLDPLVSDNNALVCIKIEIKGDLTLGRKEKFYFPDSALDPDAPSVFPLIIPVGAK